MLSSPLLSEDEIGELASLTITFRANQNGGTHAAGCRHVSVRAADAETLAIAAFLSPGPACLSTCRSRVLPLALIRALRELLRRHQGRRPEPSACIADSQIVKAHDTVPRTTSGYHGGKKITGRGQPCPSTPRAGCWPWSSPPRRSATRPERTPDHQAVRRGQHAADHVGRQRYGGAPLARYAKAAAAITVEVVERTAPHSFQVLRRRRVIERTFGSLMGYRRLVRDYERTTANSEAMIYWATNHHHDQAARPLRERPAARAPLGAAATARHPIRQNRGQRHEPGYQQALSAARICPLSSRSRAGFARRSPAAR